MSGTKVQHSITDPAGRAAALRYMRWTDHGVLRRLFTNFAEVAPGVYRSNYPDHARLERYRDMGIRSVLNLRGTAPKPPFLLEEESCAALGLTLHSVALKARQPAPKEDLVALFAEFDRIERPFVMHCKSGADRAGLAAALYLLDQGAPVAQAQAQLSLRFLHLKFTKTGVQDLMLQHYARDTAKTPMHIRDWVRDVYDPAALAADFATKRVLRV